MNQLNKRLTKPYLGLKANSKRTIINIVVLRSIWFMTVRSGRIKDSWYDTFKSKVKRLKETG